MNIPKHTTKSIPILMRTRPVLYEQLQQLAQKIDRPIAETVRIILTQALKDGITIIGKDGKPRKVA